MATVLKKLLKEFTTKESAGGCYHLAVLFCLYPDLFKNPELSNSHPYTRSLISEQSPQFKELLDKIDWSYWSIDIPHFGEQFLKRCIKRHGILEACVMMARRALGHENRYKLAAQYYGEFFRSMMMYKRETFEQYWLDEYFKYAVLLSEKLERHWEAIDIMCFVVHRSTDDLLVDKAACHVGMFSLYQCEHVKAGLEFLEHGFNRVRDGKCQAALYDYYTSVNPDPKKASLYPFPSGITPPGDSFDSIADYDSSSDSDSDSDSESVETIESYSSDRDDDKKQERKKEKEQELIVISNGTKRSDVRRPTKRKMCSNISRQRSQCKNKKIGEN